MPRKIKFRIWDKTQNKFTNPTISYTDGEWYSFGHVFLLEEKGLVLQQWTGLFDKNGVEIYEGDILSKNWRCEVFTCGNRGTFMVKFNNHPWKNKDMPLFDYLAARQKAWMSENNEDCEIIGNIFENPELLAN